MRGKYFWMGLLIFGAYAVLITFYTLTSIENEKRVLREYAEFLKPHMWQLDRAEVTRLAKLIVSSGFVVKVEAYQVYQGEGGERIERFVEVGDESGSELGDFERVLLRLGILQIVRYDEKNLPFLELYYDVLGRRQKIGILRFYVVRRYAYFYFYMLLLALAVYFLLVVNAKLGEAKEKLQRANEELNSLVEELENTIEELEKTQEQLVNSEKMASIGRLVANISHDINTPAGIIYTSISELKEFLEKLTQSYQKGEISRSFFEEFLQNSKELVELMERNIKKISDLVRGLKALVLQEGGGNPLKFNLKNLVDDILVAMYPKIRKTNIRVHVKCPDDLEMRSYPGAISQVLTNLIENSIVHAFEDGKRAGNIWIDVKDSGSYVEIVYRDDGKGMDEETRRRAFEPFFSTRLGRGGTGLGLSIVYSLVVERLKGEIELESEPGRGTKFRIVIPKYL